MGDWSRSPDWDARVPGQVHIPDGLMALPEGHEMTWKHCGTCTCQAAPNGVTER